MTVVPFQQWPQFLAQLKSSGDKSHRPQAVLIHGEELLGSQVLDELLPVLVEGGKHAAGCEPLDGDSVVWSDALEQVNTFALLGDSRLVVVRDAKLFYTARDAGGMLKKIGKAWADDNRTKAARQFVALLGLLGITIEDVAGKGAKLPKALTGEKGAKPAWLDALSDHCRENNLAIPQTADGAALLEKALEKGFPRGNGLVITTDLVDRRRTLYKALDRFGLIVDCTVPRGERAADRRVQQAVMEQQMLKILGKNGKSLAPGTFQVLSEKTGFDLRTFTLALEKLAAFVGDRETITPADVQQALIRTKQDPIFEFTNAVADRDFRQAMFYLDSLLAGEFHPLQLLAALANQLRRLLMMKDFTLSPAGQGIPPGIAFDQFKSGVLPAMAAFDENLQALGKRWAAELAPIADEDGSKPKKKAKTKSRALPAELRLAARPASAYPLYMTFKKQARFSAAELLSGLRALSEADLLLKTDNRTPRLVMERLLMQICSDG